MIPYRASAVREGDWWVLSVENVGTTQVTTLERAETAVIDMIAAVLGLDPADIEVEVFK